jgi:hypothetical protein
MAEQSGPGQSKSDEKLLSHTTKNAREEESMELQS